MMTWTYLRPKKAGRLKTPSGGETPEVVLGAHRDGAPVPARVAQVDRNNPGQEVPEGTRSVGVGARPPYSGSKSSNARAAPQRVAAQRR